MGTRVSHAVAVVTQSGRSRGECVCGWSSPWSTTRPPWPDASPRPVTFTVGVVHRAAAFHLRSPVVGR